MNFGTDVTLWLAFSAGLLSFFSPCVLPLIPSFITYITGLSFAQLKVAHPGSRVRLTVFVHSLAFVAGFSFVFLCLGALAGFASSTVQDFMQEGVVWMRRGGGLLVLLFGVHLSGLFPFGVLLGDKRVQIHNKPSGLVGTFLVGLAFAAGWTPCIGPILGSILTLAAGTTGDPVRGIALLALYSAGLGIPFLLAGLLFHGFLSFFNRFRRHIRLMEIASGILLMLVGLMLMFNLLGEVSSFFSGFVPGPSGNL